MNEEKKKSKAKYDQVYIMKLRSPLCTIYRCDWDIEVSSSKE